MAIIKVFGSGFISNHLVNQLKFLKHDVEVIHHNQEYKIDKADYIFYLLSYGNHYQQNDKYQTIKANIIDLYNLLKATKNLDYKAFIHFSTSSVILPVQTLYSDSKFVAELICKRFARKYHKKILSCRPYSVYGIGEAPFRFIPTVIRCLKEGKELKLTKGYHDWIWVEDFVYGVLSVMSQYDKFIGKTVSIGSGTQYSNEDIVKRLEAISGGKINFKYSSEVKRPYDNTNWISDNTLVYSTGWRPFTGITEGLMKCWEAI